MSVIRLQEMTPQIYTEESRDFQLLSRLYDSVFNGLKFDTDSILDLIDTKECRTSVLQLLQTKLGFFTERKIDDEKLRSILECFPILVRNKGSLRAIKETLYLFLRMYSVSSNMEIYYLPTPYSPPFSEEEPCVLASGKLSENNSLVIRIHSFETKPDTSVMEEIFKYILPAGINYYIEFDKGATLQDIVLKSEDSAELTFVSDNINSQLRSSDQTEPYNIGTVNTSSLISADSYVSNRFIGYYGDEQSASDYLATLVDKIYSTAVINYSATGEVSGPIVSISDAEAGVPVESLSVSIDPIQDLHGYDNPWPAGGGKNIFPNSPAETKTYNGITIVSDGMGKYTISGTATADGSIIFDLIDEFTIPASIAQGGSGCLYLNNSFTANSNVFIPIFMYNNTTADSWTLSAVNRVSSVYIQMSGKKCNRISFQFYAGASISGTIAPMISDDGSTNYDFYPYSNICPISGHTDADVTRTGVNVWDEEAEQGTLSTVNGSDVVKTTRIRSKNYIPVVPNNKYYFRIGSAGSANGLLTCFYDAGKNFISAAWQGFAMITMPSNTYYVRFSTGDAYGGTYNNDISINYPSTDHDYHAYSGTTYPIPLGQTVYGGTLDVLTGVLTVTHRYMLADGVNVKTTGGYGAVGPKWLPCIILATADKADPSMPIVATSYLKTSGVNVQNDENSAVQGNNGAVIALHIGTMQGTDGTHGYNSADEVHAAVNAYLQQNPLQLCYELATPITIQLTPRQVELLQGENNLWSNAGDISITYKRDSTYKAMICTAYSSNTPTWHRINFLGNLTTEEVSTQGGIVAALQAKGITVNNGDLIKYNNLYLLRVNNDWQECNYARYILNTYHLTE